METEEKGGVFDKRCALPNLVPRLLCMPFVNHRTKKMRVCMRRVRRVEWKI